MPTSLEELREWMAQDEGGHLEFKEAKNNFHFEKLVKYCAALANEGGGRMVLGVSDKRPRRVVGCQAFGELQRTEAGLVERLHLRIVAEAIAHPQGRVLVFHVPSRPIGVPVSYEGAYWMRAGEDLAPMTPDQLKKIFAETGPDFSAEICVDATLSDLEIAAIEDFRRRWIAKSNNSALANLPVKQLLTDAEAMVNGRITFAALVMFGSQQALGRFLAQAEVIFEYRSSDASGPPQQRREYRKGFFLFYEDLWNTINLRNDRQHYQEGLFVFDIPTFSERPVREALLNAVSHRDYRPSGSVFVRQYPRRLEIVSPGGFPTGISVDNVLDRQNPRNRRLADLFTKCGLVERSGQGMNLMFEECIKEGKPIPDFVGTDAFQVSLSLHGSVQDPMFVRFLEQVGKQRLAGFTTQDFLILDLINRDEKIPALVRPRLNHLLDQGILEQVARGKFIFSRKYYSFIRKKGIYTRKRGLDKEQNKALLLKHIRDNQHDGSPLQDLMQVLPSLSRDQIRTLLREMKGAGQIHSLGTTRAGRWYPGIGPIGSRPKRKPN
jgi:ATP-dependent DNA helicase RecG